MPKIRTEVVPLILDDIVDDPRVRDLIREQSQGLFLDALESVRENLADADVLVERVGRRLLRRPPRPQPESAVSLMLDAAGDEDTTPARLTRENLRRAAQRLAGHAGPAGPARPGVRPRRCRDPPGGLRRGRHRRGRGWSARGCPPLVNLLDSLFDPVPQWLVAILTAIAASFVPIYLGRLLVADGPIARLLARRDPGLHAGWAQSRPGPRPGPRLGRGARCGHLDPHRGLQPVRPQAPLVAGSAAAHRGALRGAPRPAAALHPRGAPGAPGAGRATHRSPTPAAAADPSTDGP